MDSVTRQEGLTLIELMIVIILVAVVASMAIPGWTGLVRATHKHAEVATLITLINLARNTAVQEQVSVTLCPLDDKNRCSSDWNNRITVFRDRERKRRVDDPSQIVRISESGKQGRLIVRSSSRPYFGFRPTGHAREAIGHFLWCPIDNDVRDAAQIRVNMGGRPSLSRDTNGDGIVEGTDGLPVSCS